MSPGRLLKSMIKGHASNAGPAAAAALMLLLAGVLVPIRAAGAASLAGVILRESYRSDAVPEELRYELYLPPGHASGEGLPYLLFLPGFKDDQTYCRRKGFFEITERMIVEKAVPPLAVVCASRGHGFWIDAYDKNLKYETALARDLLGRLKSVHHLSSDPAQRGILGISFGGYAALKVSLSHPGLFGSVSGFSPALDPAYEQKVRTGQYPWRIGSAAARRRMYGPEFNLDRALGEDPFWLVKNAKAPPPTAFYLTCGRQDRHGLAGPLEQLRKLLVSAGATVEGELEDGNHDASFWRRVYPQALRFHAGRFGK